jgi:hypothetical protein
MLALKGSTSSDSLQSARAGHLLAEEQDNMMINPDPRSLRAPGMENDYTTDKYPIEGCSLKVEFELNHLWRFVVFAVHAALGSIKAQVAAAKGDFGVVWRVPHPCELLLQFAQCYFFGFAHWSTPCEGE